MSNWEDGPDDLPVVAAPASKGTWEDEDAEDVKEEWDASSEEEEEEKPKEPVAPTPKKKKSVAQAAAERQAAEEKKRKELDEKRKAAAAAQADEDPQARRERLRQLELEADMANATDLFAGVSTDDKVEEEGDPEKVALEKMAPKTKEQFDQFQKALVDVIGKHKRTSLYPLFVDSFVRQLCLELKVEDIRKVASTLTSLSNEKLKASKDVGKRKKNTKKTMAVGKADMGPDTTDYGASAYDDFDDFM